MTGITDDWWYNDRIWGETPLLHAIGEDPDLEHDQSAERPEVCEQLRALAVEDAGGEVPPELARP